MEHICVTTENQEILFQEFDDIYGKKTESIMTK